MISRAVEVNSAAHFFMRALQWNVDGRIRRARDKIKGCHSDFGLLPSSSVVARLTVDTLTPMCSARLS